MSKAFLREDDAAPDPVAPLLPLSFATGGKNFLTPDGAARLRAELDQLLARERPLLAARAADDADEKRELQRLDARVRQLQLTLQTAEVIPAPPPPHDIVQFGATVTVRSADGAVSRYHIVGLDEADPAADRVSYQSPLARALLNARRGERVEFDCPAGLQRLAVIDITYD